MTYKQETIKPYNEKEEKGAQVERMFDGIAHSYDLLNHTLSFGIDRRWRKVAVKWLKQFSPDSILDVATGTGDFAILGAKEIKPKQMLGIDLPEGMLSVAREKIKKEKLEDIVSVKKENCMDLSFEDMKPGGHLAVIELTSPSHFPMNMLFKTYSHWVMPTIGRFISKDKKAYRYLPQTMEAFPKENRMKEILEKAGFKDIKIKRFTFGISMLYMASK